ncbi:hypothetical protein NL676_018640 [Syzygium grande]|nr:hypothetical protein NL676_018640 [Syzygium grande]
MEDEGLPCAKVASASSASPSGPRHCRRAPESPSTSTPPSTLPKFFSLAAGIGTARLAPATVHVHVRRV